MKRFIFVIALLAVTLTGCSKDDTVVYSDNVKPLQLPITNAGYVEFNIPEELSIVREDGQSFWVLDDYTTIYLLKTPIPTGVKSDGNCFYTDNSIYYVLPNDQGTLLISCTEDKSEYYRDSLNNLSYYEGVFFVDLLCNDTNKLGKLPNYEDCEMIVANNSLYMPNEYAGELLGFNTACYFNQGSQFLESWVMYYRLEDLIPMFLPKVLCNTNGTVTAWYEDSDVFYLESDRYVLGAKKITHNQWCCYISSNTPEMRNYLLKGINKVHFIETE